jgi:hypothetical protein
MRFALSHACWATINTRIGMPDHYWQHGTWAFLGFLGVLVLVEIAVVIMVDAIPWWSDDPRLWVPMGQQEPSSWEFFLRLTGFMTPLVAAAVLLQWLPEARMGIQFLPVSPWAFSGWFPFMISLLVWAGMGWCALIIVLPLGDKVDGFALFLLLTMGVNALLSFWSLKSS